MSHEFKLPDVGEGISEGEIVNWLVEEGDYVEENDPLVEVETDKAIIEIPSPVSGTVRELLAEEGEVVKVESVIVTFDVDDTGGGDRSSKSESARSNEV
ncbi:MAG: biotin/lipoyl-containing protein, partial [Halobacteria archaeon]|nr:biotin/lipoyl-containing protein [Halobacteria archaeon]